jgi:hypothetical protein
MVDRILIETKKLEPQLRGGRGRANIEEIRDYLDNCF